MIDVLATPLPVPVPDFRLLFESVPGLYLVLTPDLTIVAASDAYLRATTTARAGIIGRPLFEVFPDNPDDPAATGVANLRASLARVLAHRVADAMPVQKYDIRRPSPEGAEFEVRYWSAVNSPVIGPDGAVAYVIHRVEDVTEFVPRGGRSEGRLFLRAHEVLDANRELRETNEELTRLRAELERRVADRTALLTATVEALRAEVAGHERTERELRRKREKLRVTLESIGDAVVTTDTAGRVTMLNGVAEALTGWPSGEAVGLPLAEVFRIVNQKTRQPVVNPVARVLAEGAVVGLANHTVLVARDGTERPIDDSAAPIRDETGAVLGVVLIFRDVTERYAAEEALRASEERLRLLIDSVREYAIFMTDPDGRVVTWNTGAERAYGYSAAEAVGMHLSRFHPPEEEAGTAGERLARAAETGTHQAEAWRLRKDGTRFWAEVVTTVLRGDGADPRGFVVVARDMTERRKLEDQFRQAQKLEAVGRLAGGVAHDFNNLLTVINGYADVLLATQPAAGQPREALAAIRDAGERAADLTSQLLAFSRKAIVEPKVLDLNLVIDQLARLLRRLVGEDVILAAALAPNLHRVKADPPQVEQIILNLAVNARDAMPRGGRLTLETRNVRLRPGDAASYPDLPPGDYVQLAVSDSGVGMTEEVKGRIFEPFFTTKEQGKGTGLGLAMVYGAVKTHGGHVSVYSELGVGSTFKILLPATGEAPSGSRSGELRPAPRGFETVLLAEDDETVRRFTRLALETQGYVVLEGASGAEALRVATEHAGPIHLLVTDVVMPSMGGRELAEALRARHPRLRVLYVSGYTDDAVVRHGIVEATDAFLQKPFTALALARKVRAVLDGPK